MARAKFADVVVDRNGKPIPTATVTVYTTGTVTPTPATLFSAASGAGTLSNPFTSNSEGEVEFYVAEQMRLDVKYEKVGYISETHTIDVLDATHTHSGYVSEATFNTHADDATGVHGIADTSQLLTSAHNHSGVYEPVGTTAAHEADTTSVHGITDTSLLAVASHNHAGTYEVAGAIATHEADTTSVHGIADTTVLATVTQAKAEVLIVAVSDETTAITTGTAKVTFRMPWAMTLTAVRASLTTASSSGIPTIDINEGGTTILSTKLTIDANEKTSTTAATPAVISDTVLADDAEMTIDIDVAGTGAAGLKVYLIGTRA